MHRTTGAHMSVRRLRRDLAHAAVTVGNGSKTLVGMKELLDGVSRGSIIKSLF